MKKTSLGIAERMQQNIETGKYGGGMIKMKNTLSSLNRKNLMILSNTVSLKGLQNIQSSMIAIKTYATMVKVY